MKSETSQTFSPIGAVHLVIKANYFAWNRNDNDLITDDEHLKVASEHGKCWWGRMTSEGADKLEAIKTQIADGKATFAFLYINKVPKSVHPDQILWFRAELLDISSGSPNDRQLIPSYYRQANLGSAFLIMNITPLEYTASETPKVPGQAAVRDCILEGEAAPKSFRQTTRVSLRTF